jgi:hypothetical protein
VAAIREHGAPRFGRGPSTDSRFAPCSTWAVGKVTPPAFFKGKAAPCSASRAARGRLADSVIPEHVAAHDFTQGAYLPERSFDLLWSCEFLEHVESRYEANILGTFAHAAKVILVTHAFPRQTTGHHHVNCRPSSYWIQRIEALGFTCHAPLTREARTVTLQDFAGINHFARSGLVFVQASPRQPAGGLERLTGPWRARIKACKIHWSWRCSRPYLEQKRRQRCAKRNRKR